MESAWVVQMLILLMMSQFITISGQGAGSGGKTRTEMIKQLLGNNYDKGSPPLENRPTEVRIGVYINSLHTINSVAMEYSMSMYLRHSWKDPRLVFDKDEYKSSRLRLMNEYKDIWVPDAFIRNEKKAQMPTITVPNVLARVNSTGHVWYVLKISGTYSSPMRLQRFPFDTQMLPFMVESFGYTMDTLFFAWLDSPVDIDPAVQLPSFTLQDIILYDCSQNYTAGAFPCLEIRFVMVRDVGYYVLTLFVPSLLIVLLTFTTFWIGVNRPGARLGLGLFSFLMLVLLTVNGRSHLPQVSYITAMDVWFLVCLLFVFSSIMETVVVTVIANKQGIPNAGEKGGPLAKLFQSTLDMICAGVFPILFLIFVIVYFGLYV